MDMFKKNKIYGSLTTIPCRINYILPCLKSLLYQTISLDKIFLCVDRNMQIPEDIVFFELQNIKKFEIVFTKDEGPITKLVGAFDKINSEDFIITFDDDFIYPNFIVERLYLQYLKTPGCAISFAGWNNINIEIIYEDRVNFKDFKECDILEGYTGSLYSKAFFDDLSLDFSDLKDILKYFDDVWISWHLHKKNIPRIVTRIDPSRILSLYDRLTLWKPITIKDNIELCKSTDFHNKNSLCYMWCNSNYSWMPRISPTLQNDIYSIWHRKSQNILINNIENLSEISLKKRVGIVIACYNRPNYLQIVLEFLKNVQLPEDSVIIIVDDSSIYLETLILQEKFYHPQTDVIGIRFRKNLGIAKALQIGWDFCYNIGCEFFLNVDSDIILSEEWYTKLEKIYTPVAEKTIISGFNAPYHKTIETCDDICYKNSCGGAQLMWHRSLYDLVNQSLYQNNLWDWALCSLAIKNNIKIASVKDSICQHIGYIGINSGINSGTSYNHWDFSPYFGISITSNWTFYPCYDSSENDITRDENFDLSSKPFHLNIIKNLIQIVEVIHPSVKAFNGKGWIKHTIKDKNTWDQLSWEDCPGLFVRE